MFWKMAAKIFAPMLVCGGAALCGSGECKAAEKMGFVKVKGDMVYCQFLTKKGIKKVLLKEMKDYKKGFQLGKHVA